MLYSIWFLKSDNERVQSNYVTKQKPVDIFTKPLPSCLKIRITSEDCICIMYDMYNPSGGEMLKINVKFKAFL